MMARAEDQLDGRTFSLAAVFALLVSILSLAASVVPAMYVRDVVAPSVYQYYGSVGDLQTFKTVGIIAWLSLLIVVLFATVWWCDRGKRV